MERIETFQDGFNLAGIELVEALCQPGFGLAEDDLQNALTFPGQGQGHLAPVERVGGARHQAALDQGLDRLADGRQPGLAGLGQGADRGAAAPDAPQDLELLNAHLELLEGDGADLDARLAPGRRDALPEFVDDGLAGAGCGHGFL